MEIDNFNYYDITDSCTSTPTMRNNLPFSSFCTLGDDSPIDVVWYTPLAQAANWYSSPEDWVALNHLISSSTIHSPNTRVFQTFFKRSKDFDNKITVVLSKTSNFTIGRTAFKDELSNPTLHDTEVAHGFLQLLLMDRLLYFQNRHRRHSGLLASPISSSGQSLSQPDKSTLPYVDCCQLWVEKLESFVDAWELQRKARRMPDISNGAMRSRSVGLTLAEGFSRSQGKSRLAKVEGNFCLAALGIRALLIVSGLQLPAL